MNKLRPEGGDVALRVLAQADRACNPSRSSPCKNADTRSIISASKHLKSLRRASVPSAGLAKLLVKLRRGGGIAASQRQPAYLENTDAAVQRDRNHIPAFDVT